jgi:hypothetical protein
MGALLIALYWRAKIRRFFGRLAKFGGGPKINFYFLRLGGRLI